MYERHGIEVEEIDKVIMHYDLMSDPEVKRTMEKQMLKL